MFTRRVVMQIKADSSAEFIRITEGEVLPLLRGQKGCRYEDAFITSELSKAVINSFWDTKEDAEAYNDAGYPQVLKALSKVVEGTPRVGTAVVSNSTFHKIAAPAA